MPRSPRRKKTDAPELSDRERRFIAEGHYAESMIRTVLGDTESTIELLELALEVDPGYAPVILSLGSVEYQRQRPERGRKLFMSLVTLPESAADEGDEDLTAIVDEAGDFLILRQCYADGLELYREAVKRWPRRAALLQGVVCCAGHEGLHDEAIAASKAAMAVEPENQEHVNDYGWSLFEAGRLSEAREWLERAVAMKPEDRLARENLRLCREAIAEAASGEGE